MDRGKGDSGTVPSQAILSSSFSFMHPALLFARMRLYPDRIELTGWYFRGRYRLAVNIRHVLQVDIADDWELLIWLSTGESLRLRVNRPRRWKTAIDACLADADSQVNVIS